MIKVTLGSKEVYQEVLVDLWKELDDKRFSIRCKYVDIETNELVLAIHSPLVRALLTELRRYDSVS